MTLCLPFTTGKLHISNNFSYEDASVPELNKYLEPEDFEELVQRVIFLSFPYPPLGESPHLRLSENIILCSAYLDHGLMLGSSEMGWKVLYEFKGF